MDRAVTNRIEQQVSSAFPEGAITRVQVLQYGDDPEVEPGQAAIRVFSDWPGRSENKKADPKTVHAFAVANSRALDMLRDEVPRVIRWVEFRPESPAGSAVAHGLAYRITDRGRPGAASDDVPEDFTPVMVWLGSADLATLDSLITAGIVSSRAEGLRWALSRVQGMALVRSGQPLAWPLSSGRSARRSPGSSLIDQTPSLCSLSYGHCHA